MFFNEQVSRADRISIFIIYSHLVLQFLSTWNTIFLVYESRICGWNTTVYNIYIRSKIINNVLFQYKKKEPRDFSTRVIKDTFNGIWSAPWNLKFRAHHLRGNWHVVIFVYRKQHTLTIIWIDFKTLSTDCLWMICAGTKSCMSRWKLRTIWNVS
jgi:hypothetical protein